MEKRTTLMLAAGATTLATVALGGVFLLPSAIQAATDPTSTSPMIVKLAEKLGISQDKVQTAFDQSRSEIKAQRAAEMKQKISDALTAGKLTQRQADILNAIHDVRESLKPAERPAKDDLRNLTEAERKVKTDEMKTQMEQKLIDALKAKGLTVTAEELQSTHKAAEDAGLGMMGRHGGPGKMGRGEAGMMN
jgi:hypothetical protein